MSLKYFPRQIVTRCTLDFEVNLSARFSAYVEASYDRDVTNNTNSCCHGCISLGAARTLRGLLKCFDLLTGLVVGRRTFDVLPMPDRVVKLLNEWGSKSDKANYGTTLQFRNRNKVKFDWDNDELEEDEDLIEDEIRDNHHPSLPAEIPGVELERYLEGIVVESAPKLSC